MARFWSPREEELLQKLWGEPQITRENLTDVFNRSWDSLHKKAQRMELPARKNIESKLDEELLKKLMEVIDG